MLTIQECVYEGVHIVRLKGRVTLGTDSSYLQEYFKRRIESGIRYFVLDCDGIGHVDSAGLAVMGGMAIRLKMRAGRAVFINNRKLSEVFEITQLKQLVDIAPDLASAFELIRGAPVKVPARLKFEDQYTVTMEGQEGARKLVVDDKTTEPPQKTEYTVRDIPPRSPERLSIVGMAGVAFATLAFLSLLIVGLIWVTKQVSSMPILVLIFSIALLVSFCLLTLLLLLSGHLSEKTAEKLFTGVLGKVPGLSTWMPKVAARKTKG